MPTAYKQKTASTLELALAAITLVAIIKQKRTVLMHCANSGIERKQRACEALGATRCLLRLCFRGTRVSAICGMVGIIFEGSVRRRGSTK